MNNLMRGDTVRDLDPPAIAAITLGFAAGAVGLAFMVGPLAAAALWLGVALV